MRISDQKFKASLTAKNVTKICDAAAIAWERASDRKRSVKFLWKGKPLVSTLTNLRMLVKTVSGTPICSRFH